MLRGALPRFLLLYAVTYAAFGVASPFVPAFLQARGLTAAALGVVLAAGTAVRLVSGPVAGRLADRLGAPRLVLTGCTAAAAAVAGLYLPAAGFVPLLLVGVLHAAVLAPLTPLGDALAVGAARAGAGFDYGTVRGAGSAAFIVGVVLSGQAVARFGLQAAIWQNAALLAAAAVAAACVPQETRAERRAPAGPAARGGSVAGLLRLPRFGRMMLVAALIQGSHALHDGFAVIRWTAAGVGPGTSAVLWSEAVAAEVVVFLLLGGRLLDRLGPGGASALCAAAGVLRWGVLASTTAVPVLAVVEPLHGLTFALQHLAVMRLLARVVPPGLLATAQAFYGTVAVGAATALLTLACGPLFERLGAGAFWAMGALCLAALPLCGGLGPAAPDLREDFGMR